MGGHREQTNLLRGVGRASSGDANDEIILTGGCALGKEDEVGGVVATLATIPVGDEAAAALGRGVGGVVDRDRKATHTCPLRARAGNRKTKVLRVFHG